MKQLIAILAFVIGAPAMAGSFDCPKRTEEMYRCRQSGKGTAFMKSTFGSILICASNRGYLMIDSKGTLGEGLTVERAGARAGGRNAESFMGEMGEGVQIYLSLKGSTRAATRSAELAVEFPTEGEETISSMGMSCRVAQD